METKPDPQPAPTITDIATMAVHLSYLRKDMTELKAETTKNFDEIKKTLSDASKQYVSIESFVEHIKIDEQHENRISQLERNTSDIGLMRQILYGACAFILTTVLGAIVYLVIRK